MAQVRSDTERDRYLSATEAKEYGIVDEVNLDVAGLPARAAQWLMKHHATVREGSTLARGSSREQHGGDRSRLADARRGHGAAYVLHRVVNRE